MASAMRPFRGHVRLCQMSNDEVSAAVVPAKRRHPDDAGRPPPCRARTHEGMRTALIVSVALFLAGGLAACADEEKAPDRPQSAEPRTPVDEVTVDQLLKNPGAYDGAVVVVRDAKFVPIEPEGAFVLQGEEGRILVSSPGGVPKVDEGETVPVRGELVRFTEPAAEALGEEFETAEELGDTPTDVGDPYLLLRSLPDAGAGTGSTAEGVDQARAELAAIVERPRERFGDQVSVAGRVARTGDAAFVLEAEGRRLLVVPQTVPADIPTRGSTIRASGTIERMPAEDDPAVLGEKDLFDDFEGEPTLAATDYEPVGS